MKQIIRWVLAVLICLFVFGLWYDWNYSMGIADSYEINDKKSTYSLLITTQKSDYKDKVTQKITDGLRGKDIYVKVIDQTKLFNILPEEYDAFIFLHTWEMWKAPHNISELIHQADMKDKTFVVSTSGGGELYHDGINGISSASIILDAEADAAKVHDWIENLLTI